jgi:hypothetical protein
MRRSTVRTALICLVAVGVVLGMAPAEAGPAPAQTFTDVPPSHPFYEEIEWAAANGIANGYADGTFRPGKSVSKEALAAFTWRVAGEPEPDNTGCEKYPCWSDDCIHLNDILDTPFYWALWWSMSKGGVACPSRFDGVFRPYYPSHPQTRERAMRVILTGLDIPGHWEPPSLFSDVPYGQATNYGWVQAAAELDIANGYPNGTFRPNANVSRMAAIAFLYRAAHLPD